MEHVGYAGTRSHLCFFKTTQGNASVKAEGLNVPNTRNQTFSKQVDVKTVGEINPPLVFAKVAWEK